jgi:flagellar L-ring protein precursor FlgH
MIRFLFGTLTCFVMPAVIMAQAAPAPAPKPTDATSSYLQTGAATVRRQPVTESLYQAAPIAEVRVKGRVVNRVLEAASLTAVPTDEPRKFSKHDLITIVIRERSSATLTATLETEKESENEFTVNAFPKLLGGRLTPSLRGGVESEAEFEGEGDYRRRDTVDIELQARVIDIRPNGNLVLEAHKFIKNDDEELTVTVTGEARPDDITLDNRLLGTQLAQLRVHKVHEGELRKTTTKGFFTQVLEFIFNF